MVDYVMVPREPTEDMLTRGVWELTDGEPNRDDLADAYRAMLSAAPASPIPISVNGAGEREAFEAGWDARELKQTGLSAAGYADNSYDVNVAWSLYDRAPAIAALSPALDNTAVEVLRETLTEVRGYVERKSWDAYDDREDKLIERIDAALSPALDNTAVEEYALRKAVEGLADDYMTSEQHHPGYVLIPTAKFDAICAALSASPSTPIPMIAEAGEQEALIERLRAIHRRQPSEYAEVCAIIDAIRALSPALDNTAVEGLSAAIDRVQAWMDDQHRDLAPGQIGVELSYDDVTVVLRAACAALTVQTEKA